MRYFLYLSYKGTHYHGWQKQPNAASVQATLEEKMSTVLRESIEVTASGRTDTGVHAKEQVVHFDFGLDLDTNDCIYKFNRILPPDIAVHKLCRVADEGHARFDAVSRSYEYHIGLQKNPFEQGLSYQLPASPNLKAMNNASGILLSHKDFESFSKVKTDVYTFNCDIFEAYWRQDNAKLVFHVSANRFLRGMIRALVGTLLEVGAGRITVEQFEQIILAKNRKKAGRAVPPQGLYLNRIIYPKEIFKYK